MSMFTAEQAEKLFIKIENIELGTRAQKFMKSAGISHVAVLLAYPEEEIRGNGVGRITYTEIETEIKKLGFQVGMLCEHDTAIRIDSPYPDQVMLGLRLRALNVIPEPKAPPVEFNDFEKWVLDKLPEGLREGLRPEFLRAKLAEPRTQQEIKDAITSIVAAKLGLNHKA